MLDMSKQVYDRKRQGELIAKAKGSIKRLDDRNYVVNSQSGNGYYCSDHVYRGVKCKHIHDIDALRELE
jgi:hypothetical protein